jgi:SAM-dependent methyltransferase
VRVRLKHRVVAVARSLPAPLKALVRWGLEAIDPLLVWWAKRRYDYREPVPPMRLRLRVGSTYLGDFIKHGGAAVEHLEAACRGQGRSLADAESLLDFGCGCGRVLVPMRRSPLLSGCRLVGSDVDAELIGWLRAAHPDLELAVNSFSPPLPFEDDEFDVIVSYSVFTHLDERSQFAWLRELRRVLSPDGVALLTVQGPAIYEAFRDGRFVANSRACARRVAGHGSLEREGFIFELFDRDVSNQVDFSGIDSDYGLTFHSREYIERSWSPILAVQSVVAPPQQGQDVVVATRPNGDLG